LMGVSLAHIAVSLALRAEGNSLAKSILHTVVSAFKNCVRFSHLPLRYSQNHWHVILLWNSLIAVSSRYLL
jgi:hypothetical protein